MQLIEAGSPKQVNYAAGVIYRLYEQEGAVYYFALHPQLFPIEDALAPTGSYFTVLLTPHGLRMFFILPGVDGFYVQDPDLNAESIPAEGRNVYVTESGSMVGDPAMLAKELDQYNDLSRYLPLINQAIIQAKG